ncbi:sn-glycerol-1-phosphate dehydrogenase [Dongia sedimenti]|uniref:Sn-glycerol-1-phosphate dehydrogenase n=1 Tax=Dongia sedimenti TaxID=3064282 RepID=A0ABU0YUH3_9PROT|nr:sn-glycerol-1-phosphate dehydrogenase [Rhodospirillaceae bacterium R-7]
MSEVLLRRLLAGNLRDPDSGEGIAVPTRKVTIAPSLRGGEAALIADLGLGSRLALIADPTTWQVLGARVSGALAARFTVTPVILPERPHADMETVQRIRAATSLAEGLVAVGSGTINDLAKYAAFLDRKPYACFGTAPSMNGYTSVNAAIMDGGVKKSLPAAAARGVFLDVDILAKAPRRMIAAGFGDSICRPTAQADWLLAHLLLDRPYRALPFQLLAEDETALLASPEGLLSGDPEAITRLARTLVMSGFGMTICGGSYPASQGEHLIAHFLEMRGDPAGANFHGEQIAVTTLTMARIQGETLRLEQPRLAPAPATIGTFLSFYGADVGATCWASFAGKLLSGERLAAVNHRLTQDWPEIRQAIRAVHRSATALESTLRRCGAPTRPSDIGLSDERYAEAVLHAREVRDRYTFLDLAADTGTLTRLVGATPVPAQ